MSCSVSRWVTIANDGRAYQFLMAEGIHSLPEWSDAWWEHLKRRRRRSGWVHGWPPLLFEIKTIEKQASNSVGAPDPT